MIELLNSLRHEMSENAYIKIYNAALELDLPYTYPVPEGYEVVDYDDDVVTDTGQILNGQVAGVCQDEWALYYVSDLHLRRKL